MMDNRNPETLVGVDHVAKMLGISPTHVRQLADAGTLPATRTSGGHRRFDPTAARDAWALYLPTRHRSAASTTIERRLLSDGDEAALWDAISAKIDLRQRALDIAHYVTTEMVNNAIDHSHGTTVTVTAVSAAATCTMEVADDGEGIFVHLATGLDLANPLESLAELTKGKRTTDPNRHTGEGIFFSSKAVEVFTVEANGLRITFDNARDDFAYGASAVTSGTVVRYTIDPNTNESIRSLFERFTDDDLRFSRTIPRIKLYEIGVRFVSRSEAKRLGVGLEKFAEVVLDFTGVDDIGQGFADELFRVWATSHPQTVLQPVGMNDAVDFMIRRTRPN